jgi:hypothetical protein
VLCTASLIGWAATAVAQDKPAFDFQLHGFVTGSVFAQDAKLGASYGQDALFVAGIQPTQDRLILSGDIRQTRLNFSVRGPKVFTDATPTGIVEIDFFGGDSAGARGGQSVFPRIRLAIVRLATKSLTVDVGQDNVLLVAQIPASMSHIAFPWSYAAGTIGWRWPGLRVGYAADLGDGMVLNLAAELRRGAWNDNGGIPTGFAINCTAVPAGGGTPTCTTGAATTGAGLSPSVGEAGFPMVEARAMLTLKSPFTIVGYVVGHYDTKDLSGFGNAFSAPARDTMDSYAGEIGFKVNPGDFTLAGNAWIGLNMGHMLGHSLQFTPNAGNVHGLGGWIQAGYNVSKEFSAWLGTGIDAPASSYDEFIRSGFGRIQNNIGALMLRYADGPYACGVEWFHWWTKVRTASAATSGTAEGNQLIFSAHYSF